jgi:hypothetical protein
MSRKEFLNFCLLFFIAATSLEIPMNWRFKLDQLKRAIIHNPQSVHVVCACGDVLVIKENDSGDFGQRRVCVSPHSCDLSPYPPVTRDDIV